MKYKLIIKKNLNQQIIWTGSGSTIWIALFASGHYQLNITWDHPDIFPSLTSLLIVASSLHVLTFSTLCLGRFLICKIHSAFHSRGTYCTFNRFQTLQKRSGCHAIAAGHRGAHSKYLGGGVLFNLGPTFVFVSDKCTDVYLPSFLQVPKPTQLKIQM